MAFVAPVLNQGIKKNRSALSNTLNGGGAFSPSSPTISGDPRFDTLANTEIGNRNALGEQFYGDINKYGQQYGQASGAMQNKLQDMANQRAGLVGQYGTQFGQEATGLQNQIQGLASQRAGLVNQYGAQFGSDAAAQREALVKSLQDIGGQTFQMQNPYILQDLNARGLSSSPTEVGASQANALKEIALQNQRDITNYDLSTFDKQQALKQQAMEQQMLGYDPALAERLFGQGQDINKQALEQKLGGIDSDFAKTAFNNQQDILSNALSARMGQQSQGLTDAADLYRTKLQSDIQAGQAAAEQQQAEELAKRQSRDQITNSLIGVGGSLAGGLLARGAGASLAGGAGGAGGASTAFGPSLPGVGTGFVTPFSKGVLPGGAGVTGQVLGAGAGLLGGGMAGQQLAKLAGGNSNEAKAGSLVGAGIGTYFGGPLGGTIGGAIGGLGTKAVQGIGKATGLNKPANQVGKAIKKLCFAYDTPITMDDGSTKRICDVRINDVVKGGGEVYSLRMSKSGDLYNYKGITVTGSHAVNENGKWIRVGDSSLSVPQPGETTVFSLCTDNHRLYINGIEMADEHESDDYETLSIDESLEYLNSHQLVEVA